MVLERPAPLPGEYRFLELGAHAALRRARPADHGERVLVAVDCAQATRIVGRDAARRQPLVVNIDHHHDNTRFGDVDLVVAQASSTGELLGDVVRRARRDAHARDRGGALHGDRHRHGRFQYSNTTPKALRLAADLVEAGADVHKVFQGVYESMPVREAEAARAGARARAALRGRRRRRLVPAPRRLRRGRAPPSRTRRASSTRLRAVEGAELAALIREPPTARHSARKVSLRTSVDGSTSRRSPALSDGGGHRQAAGFSSDLSIAEITRVHRARVRRRDGDDAVR